MKITQSLNNMGQNYACKSFKQGIPENPIYIPNAVGKLGKVVGEYVNTPEQKLFLALTALIFRPKIDLKCADEDSKVDAAIKSASKAIAGGITGVSIRALFQGITNHYIGFYKHNKLNLGFFPQEAVKIREDSPALANVRMKQYCDTLGTFFAVLFMILFSNSKMDVPITNDLQDLLTGVVKEKKTWLQSFATVSSNRYEKISR
jgi:hypothetical protein